jgi:hypothetical protein
MCAEGETDEGLDKNVGSHRGRENGAENRLELVYSGRLGSSQTALPLKLTPRLLLSSVHCRCD